MRSLPYAMVVVLAMITVARSQEVRSGGRFALAPSELGGFVRLDTETGAMSHCGKRDGVWRCDVLLAEDSSVLQGRIDTLRSEVNALRSAVEALTARLDARPRQPTAEEKKREMDQALGFTEQVMRRFFDMVREMKREDSDRS